MGNLLTPLTKTLLIIDKVQKIERDKGGEFYMNERGEKCYISKSATAQYLRRNSTNVLELQAQIAELKSLLRKMGTKK